MCNTKDSNIVRADVDVSAVVPVMAKPHTDANAGIKKYKRRIKDVSPSYEADILFTFTCLTKWVLTSVSDVACRVKKSASYRYVKCFSSPLCIVILEIVMHCLYPEVRVVDMSLKNASIDLTDNFLKYFILLRIGYLDR